jgi:endo-1,4-beta-xylanase
MEVFMMHSYRKLASYAGYCILAMLIFIAGNANAQVVNINGNFEDSPVGVDTSYQIQGWFIQVAAAATPLPVFEIVSDTVERGSRALKITVHGAGANQWDVQIVSDSIPVVPGRSYRYSVWAKASKAGCQVNFTVGNYAFTEYPGGVIRPATLSTDWQNFTMTFTVNDANTVIRAPIHFGYTADTGETIWIDDLRILDATAGMKPVVIEAESGAAGSNYPTLTDGGVTYVSPAADFISGLCPYDTSRVITYQVTFADSGHYNLFSRVRVGPTGSGFNDDSYYYGNGWGVKDAGDSSGAAWIRVNGLASAGFTDPMATVDAAGGAGIQVWKWVNHKNGFGEPAGIPFWVPLDSLVQTFEIGARENGLDIDKLAFGRSNLFFTVTNLDSVQVGSGALDTGAVWQGPALAHGQEKFLGCTYNGPDANFTKYWNQVTPGNAGKFGSVGVSADTAAWNWSTLNAAYVLAKSNSLPFKDHCLIWGNQQPAWISGLDTATQAAVLDGWIHQVGIRFPNTDMVDVVNEPLHNPPDGGGTPTARANYIQAMGGSGATGWDWVIWAFTKARQYMPNAKLLLNEYSIINSNSATDSYLAIIDTLKVRGLIDGIGVQGHRFELETADTTTMKNNLDRLAATGLPVYISEFDLGNVGNSGTPNDQAQLNLYKKIFPVLWRHPGIEGITIWDYIEGQTWQTTCYLVRSTGSYRPALGWLAQFIANPVGVEKTGTQLPSKYALEQNYPNPFNPTTNIRYSITKTSPVTLEIFDILGRQVQTLVNTVQTPGQYTVTFSAKNLASGVYFYQLHAGSFTETKKLMLLK